MTWQLGLILKIKFTWLILAASAQSNIKLLMNPVALALLMAAVYLLRLNSLNQMDHLSFLIHKKINTKFVFPMQNPLVFITIKSI